MGKLFCSSIRPGHARHYISHQPHLSSHSCGSCFCTFFFRAKFLDFSNDNGGRRLRLIFQPSFSRFGFLFTHYLNVLPCYIFSNPARRGRAP
jgi:hypothetical protein